MGIVRYIVSSSPLSQTLHNFIKTIRNQIKIGPNQNATPFQLLYPDVSDCIIGQSIRKSASHFYSLRGDLSNPVGSCWMVLIGVEKENETFCLWFRACYLFILVSFFQTSPVFSIQKAWESWEKISLWPETVLLSGRSWSSREGHGMLPNMFKLYSTILWRKRHPVPLSDSIPTCTNRWGALLLGSVQSCILIPNGCPTCHNFLSSYHL